MTDAPPPLPHGMDSDALAAIRPDFRPDRERFPFEASWPADVWSIGINRMDLIGVDGEGNLYWNGKPIEYRKPLVLTVWQRVGAVLLALSAVTGAGAAAVSAYADWLNLSK